MTATRCLFVPVGSWGDDLHVSFGVHLEDEKFDGILCGDCGAITDREDCVILWEETMWGKGAPAIGESKEYVDFNISMILYNTIDHVYQHLKEEVQKNS